MPENLNVGRTVGPGLMLGLVVSFSLACALVLRN